LKIENGKLLSSLRSRISFPSRWRGVRGGAVFQLKIENGKWKIKLPPLFRERVRVRGRFQFSIIYSP